MKAVCFDLNVENLRTAIGFFAKVFGWRFARFPMPREYYRICAGESAEPGGLAFGMLHADPEAR